MPMNSLEKAAKFLAAANVLTDRMILELDRDHALLLQQITSPPPEPLEGFPLGDVHCKGFTYLCMIVPAPSSIP